MFTDFINEYNDTVSSLESVVYGIPNTNSDDHTSFMAYMRDTIERVEETREKNEKEYIEKIIDEVTTVDNEITLIVISGETVYDMMEVRVLVGLLTKINSMDVKEVRIIAHCHDGNMIELFSFINLLSTLVNNIKHKTVYVANSMLSLANMYLIDICDDAIISDEAIFIFHNQKECSWSNVHKRMYKELITNLMKKGCLTEKEADEIIENRVDLSINITGSEMKKRFGK